jgi:CHAT domain
MESVIFLSFANSRNEPLPTLIDEDKAIYKSLILREIKRHFRLHRETYATINDITDYLTIFKKSVVIFHYSGHAGKDRLLLDDKNAFSDGIAQLLAQQTELKLVFLNGCSTFEQVDALLKVGIPAVIATSQPIRDTLATEFSTKFYQAIAAEYNLVDAFNLAAGHVKTLDNSKDIQVRDLAKMTSDLAKPAEMPWGLYTHPLKSEILQWKLPNIPAGMAQINTDWNGQAASNQGFAINAPLTKSLFKILQPIVKNTEREAWEEMQEIVGFDENIDEIQRTVTTQNFIINYLVAPIAVQFQKLFAFNTGYDILGKLRLEQLVITYNTLFEFVTYILMTQLWDETQKADKKLNITPEQRKMFGKFFQREASEVLLFDYMPLIRTMSDIFKTNNVTVFMEEMRGLNATFTTDPVFMKAYQQMESMKIVAFSPIETVHDEVKKSYCIPAEESLATIFEYLGFCAKYKMMTIKNIEVLTPRHSEANYLHFKANLGRIYSHNYDAYISKPFKKFAHNKSVLLVKDYENIDDFLNVSPLMIDENALKGAMNSRVFFFSHCDKLNGKYIYKFVNDQTERNFIEINDAKYPLVKKQFEAFFKDVVDEL